MLQYHCSLKSGIACSDDIKKEKAPNKKRETAACGSACLRAATPPSSLASFLSSFGGCAASFSCPLRASLSSCGRLAPPTPLPFPVYFSIMARGIQVINFFSFAITISSLINHCVTVLGYTALNLKAFGHKILSFGKFFLLNRKMFVPL